MWRSESRAQAPSVIEDLEGVAYDGRNFCAHNGCGKRMTLADDKPDKGWAVVVIRRYGKTAERVATVVVCPKHSVGTTERQTSFNFAHGKYESGIG